MCKCEGPVRSDLLSDHRSSLPNLQFVDMQILQMEGCTKISERSALTAYRGLQQGDLQFRHEECVWKAGENLDENYSLDSCVFGHQIFKGKFVSRTPCGGFRYILVFFYL